MKNNQDGFTLIEVMFALAVFMISVMAVLSMQAVAIKGTADSSSMDKAVKIASSTAEDLQKADYSAIESKEVVVDNYKVKTTVTAQTDYKMVNLALKWNKDGRDRNYNLDFLIFDPTEI